MKHLLALSSLSILMLAAATGPTLAAPAPPNPNAGFVQLVSNDLHDIGRWRCDGDHDRGAGLFGRHDHDHDRDCREHPQSP